MQENEGLNPNRLKQAREEYEDRVSCPEGYIEVRLSTRGKIGAPEKFHIRNFSAEDLMNLGLADQENVPIKLLETIQSLIFEKDVDVGRFHEKEVIELLLLLYETFYTEVFPNQEWIPTEEDIIFLKNKHGGDTDEFRSVKRALDNKQWKPTFDINIKEDLGYHEINPDIKINARIDREFAGKKFSAVFALPRFGDFMPLKYFIESIYKDKDKQFARIGEMIKFRKDMEEKLQRGENVDISKIPNVPKAEMDKYKEYETEKSLFSIRASIALYLQEFNGENVSKMPLEKKIELAGDPRLDYSTFKMVQDHFNKLEFGLKEEITVYNPIQEKIVNRKYTFQLLDLLTAIRDTGTSKTIISAV